MDILYVEWLLHYQRYSVYVLELHERSDWRFKHKQAGGTGCSLIQHFEWLLQDCTCMAIRYTTTHDNKSYVPYDCILNNDVL